MRPIEIRQALISVAESSRILGESPKAIYSMIRCQLLPPGVAVRIGRKVRIHRERLLAWLGSGRASIARRLETQAHTTSRRARVLAARRRVASGPWAERT